MRLPVFLRRAEPGDTAEVARLERAVSLHPWSEGQVRDELARPAPDAVLVLQGPPGILAWCAVRLVVGELHVMNLAVDGRVRRRGLAGYLLQKSLERGARAGAVRALLEVRAGNAAARALYAKAGFTPIGERKAYYPDPPEDALVLARELKHQSSLN